MINNLEVDELDTKTVKVVQIKDQMKQERRENELNRNSLKGQPSLQQQEQKQGTELMNQQQNRQVAQSLEQNLNPQETVENQALQGNQQKNQSQALGQTKNQDNIALQIQPQNYNQVQTQVNDQGNFQTQNYQNNNAQIQNSLNQILAIQPQYTYQQTQISNNEVNNQLQNIKGMDQYLEVQQTIQSQIIIQEPEYNLQGRIIKEDLKIIKRTGKPVRIGINPISRYNHIITLYNYSYVQVDGIKLNKIPGFFCTYWAFDIYIYAMQKIFYVFRIA